MKRVLTILILMAFWRTAHCQVADSVSIVSFKPEDFRTEISMVNKPVIVDVREFFEYKKSRIKGAINIPASGNLELSADTLDKLSNYFMYCTSGFRSKRVVKYFTQHGFTKVYNLEGGISAWKKAGLPVEKKRIRRM